MVSIPFHNSTYARELNTLTLLLVIPQHRSPIRRWMASNKKITRIPFHSSVRSPFYFSFAFNSSSMCFNGKATQVKRFFKLTLWSIHVAQCLVFGHYQPAPTYRLHNNINAFEVLFWCSIWTFAYNLFVVYYKVAEWTHQDAWNTLSAQMRSKMGSIQKSMEMTIHFSIVPGE